MLTTDLAQLLHQVHHIAIVGLSPKTHRASYQVAAFLQSKGKHIIPVNPTQVGQSILGEVVHATLLDAAQVHPIDMVDVFRSSDEVLPIAQEAIAIRAQVLWMQLGVINADAATLARKAGLQVVMDHCPKIEWR